MKSTVIKAVLTNYFQDKPVLKAYLFGSAARNEDDTNSDIDILVELDYTQTIGLKFIQMKMDLEKLLNKKVDLLSQKSVSKLVKPYIDKDKILMYAR